MSRKLPVTKGCLTPSPPPPTPPVSPACSSPVCFLAQTVDFDAQDDSFMAKHLVEAGAQDIPVGTPIFVTVEDADSVAAFKDFKPEAVAEEAAAPTADAAPTPEPVAEEKVAVAAPPPPPAPAAAPAAAPPAAPVAAMPAAHTEAAPVPAPKAQTTSGLVFKRDWGSGVSGSPLAHRYVTKGCFMFVSLPSSQGYPNICSVVLCFRQKISFGVNVSGGDE